MSTSLQLKITELNQMEPTTLLEDERVENKFVTLYNSIHGQKSGALIYHREKFNFMRLISENPNLRKCTRLSLYGSFIDMAVSGLSLDQGSKPLAYLITRKAKNGESYEDRCYLTISPYGELVMRLRAGQIRHADNPVIVYEGDLFEPELLPNGEKSIRYKPAIPRKSDKIIGSFIRITRNDGTTDIQWLLQADINRLKSYSERQNKGVANSLYTSNSGQIDPGFLEAKTIKHAFRSYPKVRTGAMTVLESNEEPQPIDYGLDAPVNTDQPAEEVLSAEVTEAESVKPSSNPSITTRPDVF